MAAWITHLRVAERLTACYAIPDPAFFCLGNVAPDSGLPTADGLSYAPSKEVSHFKGPDAGGRSLVSPQRFADQYLAAPHLSRTDASFLLGYLTHLVTDRLWALDVLAREKQRFADLLERDKVGFYRLVKRDWYDQDLLYLRTHPDFDPWQRYIAMPDVTNRWLPFFAADAFARRREEMAAFYQEGSRTVCDRPMTILTGQELNAFVDSAAALLRTQWRPLFEQTLRNAR